MIFMDLVVLEEGGGGGKGGRAALYPRLKNGDGMLLSCGQGGG